MSTRTLIGHNLDYLRQALDLLASTDDSRFAECRAPYFASSVGDHLRHIIEHYQCFLKGIPTGCIDYDARVRDHAVASDRSRAAEAIARIMDGLEAVEDRESHVRVRLDGGSTSPDADPWSTSTVKRELQYLQAHTVHHYALISFIQRLQGLEPPATFGVAPSTLRFQAAGSAAD